MDEEWRPVTVGEFGQAYEVSNLGRVRRTKGGRGGCKAGHFMALTPDRKGYRYIHLHFNGKNLTVKAHKLVAEAFIGPRPVGHEINHKNGVKGDNRVENLEYVTPSQNSKHRHDVLGYPASPGAFKKGERHKNAKLTDQQVIEIKRLLREGVRQAEIARRLGVRPPNVSKIANGQRWSHIQLEDAHVTL